MDLGDGDDAGLQGIDRAADDGLQGAHEFGCDHHGIDAQMRHGGVGALAPDHDLEGVEGGHHRPRPESEGAGGQSRPVVHAVDGLHGELLEQAVLHHDPAAAFVFLGRLEDEVNGALELAGLGQVAGGAKQHGRVAVVAAGVHFSWGLRLVGDVARLLDEERVHVGAQPHRRPVARAKRADDAGPRQAPVHGDAEFIQQPGDDAGRALLFEGCLGVGVQVPPPGGHVAVKSGDALDDGHGSAS